MQCPKAPVSQEEVAISEQAKVTVNGAVSRRWKPGQILAKVIEVASTGKKLNGF